MSQLMSIFPLTTDHFQVYWGGKTFGFTKVSGLSIENGVIDIGKEIRLNRVI
jgi:hypothetical protein